MSGASVDVALEPVVRRAAAVDVERLGHRIGFGAIEPRPPNSTRQMP